jgi:AcrR family transcriptional regulator
MAEPAAPGQRERNKIDKLQRIKDAAHRLFAEKGVDDATVREIARAAGVGLGTLFLYASDKRDLLFLLCTDELEALTVRAFTDAPRGGDFLDEIVGVLTPYYEYFAAEPGLSRSVLRELIFFVDGEQGRRFQQNRRRVIAGLTERSAVAMAEGRIRASAEAEVVGRMLFGLYQAELRAWLLDDAPDPAAGTASLRRVLKVAMDGLAP